MPGPKSPLVAAPLLAFAMLAAPAAPAPPVQEALRTGLERSPETEVAARIAELSALPHVERFRLGTSRAGHDIEGLQVRGTNDEAPLNRPAILVLGNLEGVRGTATTAVLALAEKLANGDEGAAALLAAATVYFVPQPNPDATLARLASPLFEQRATGTGRDTDRDGQVGEDPPADVDGDGLITWMRVPDPSGKWIADPHDPRANVEADSTHAERGMWKLVREGFDQDGDGEASEDAPLDAEVNANFPAGFEEHTAAGGLFGGDEPEARALMDFVLLHPELVLVITLDGQDTLVSAPETTPDPSGGGRFSFGPRKMPDGKMLKSDADVVAELGRRFVEHAEDAPKGPSHVAGSFQRWAYEHRGILTLDSVYWSMPTEAPKAEKAESEAEESEATEEVEEAEEIEEEKLDTWRKPSDDAGRLAWMDATGESWRFVDWKPFDHPQLGPVEIGGWAPYALTEPTVDAIEGLVEEQWLLLTGLADVLPRVEVAYFTAEELGGNLWRIEARLENPALLPLVTQAASRARTTTRAKVELELPKGASLIAGQTPEFVRRLDGLGRSGNEAEFEWLVHAKDIERLTLTVTTRNAGTSSTRVELAPKTSQPEAR